MKTMSKPTMLRFLFLLALGLMCLSAGAQPPKVPRSMRFADETIRFDNNDMIERMDRELITFTYMHTTSTLMLKRSRRIFAEVEPVLRENGVPEDLKYLMVIESNLDPSSVSTAGAAGLWQFMSATARAYGLEVNANVDERYNIRKSTEAACRYLKEAYAKYGDWMTVAASYNAGQAGVSRMLNAQQQKSAMQLWMLPETMRYMFRILAAKRLFEDPSSFGFTVEEEDYYPYLPPRTVVRTTDPVESLVAFAAQYGITYAQLRSANLWLREDKLNNASHKEYQIVIPQVR
ncbi:MAG: lytic transglycosylase domain-containing protein [Bacteroidales bacterium]|nr:lytic transglycosylase domain-containing protein [Bacteroidales bacterium]